MQSSELVDTCTGWFLSFLFCKIMTAFCHPNWGGPPELCPLDLPIVQFGNGHRDTERTWCRVLADSTEHFFHVYLQSLFRKMSHLHPFAQCPKFLFMSFQYEPPFMNVDPTKNRPVDSHRDERTDVAQTNATAEVDRSIHISHTAPQHCLTCSSTYIAVSCRRSAKLSRIDLNWGTCFLIDKWFKMIRPPKCNDNIKSIKLTVVRLAPEFWTTIDQIMLQNWIHSILWF